MLWTRSLYPLTTAPYHLYNPVLLDEKIELPGITLVHTYWNIEYAIFAFHTASALTILLELAR